MKISSSRRPSPAIVVAVAALAFAMVGTAIAGTDGLSEKITKAKVKKVSKKQATKQLKANVDGSHVNIADSATTATTATNATNAGDADTVNEVEIHRFFFQAPPNTVDATIETFGPLTLKASCNAAGNPTLRGSWSGATNNIKFDGSTAAQSGNANTPANSTINLSETANFGSVGFAHAQAIDKSFSTEVEYFTRDSPALGENQCFYTGTVTVG